MQATTAATAAYAVIAAENKKKLTGTTYPIKTFERSLAGIIIGGVLLIVILGVCNG